jgi:uncharacterized damage-inducible protein DinB
MMHEERRELLTVDPLSGCVPEIGRMLSMLEDTRSRTNETLESLSDAALKWEPTRDENSIGTLLYHLAAVEADWLYVEILGQTPFPTEIVDLFPRDMRDDEGRLSVAETDGLATHVDRLAIVRHALLDVYTAMSLAEFRRARHLPDYDVTPEYVLHHLMQHEAEHRGQIGLLRVLYEASPSLNVQ